MKKEIKRNPVKEMLTTLLKNKKRDYTNKEIAEAFSLPLPSVRAMAAWHHPNLKKKRASKK